MAGMSHANSLVRLQGRGGKGKMTKEKVQWLDKARLLFLRIFATILFEEKNSKRVVLLIRISNRSNSTWCDK